MEEAKKQSYQDLNTKMKDSTATTPILDSFNHLSNGTERGRAREGGFFDIVNTTEKFEVKLDVAQFKPEEITVRTREQEVVVVARSEEKRCEHEKVTREQTRRCQLPREVDAALLSSELDANGILTIRAPKLVPPPPGEREIQIKLVG